PGLTSKKPPPVISVCQSALFTRAQNSSVVPSASPQANPTRAPRARLRRLAAMLSGVFRWLLMLVSCSAVTSLQTRCDVLRRNTAAQWLPTRRFFMHNSNSTVFDIIGDVHGHMAKLDSLLQ